MKRTNDGEVKPSVRTTNLQITNSLIAYATSLANNRESSQEIRRKLKNRLNTLGLEHVQKIKNLLLRDNVSNNDTAAVEHETFLQNCSSEFMDAHNKRREMTNQELESEIDSINSSIKALKRQRTDAELILRANNNSVYGRKMLYRAINEIEAEAFDITFACSNPTTPVDQIVTKRSGNDSDDDTHET
jgi:hypothetical protein